MIFRYPFYFQKNCRCNQFYPVPEEPENVEECEIQDQDNGHTPENKGNDLKELPDFGGIFIKNTSLGGIIIPDNMDKGTTYKVASANIQTSCFSRYLIKLCFTCNIATTDARINLNFQIFKQGYVQSVPVPISCNYSYIRNTDSNETNAFSFVACDYDSLRYNCCNYSVHTEIVGGPSVGVTSIANANLAVIVFEYPRNR